MVEEGRRLAAIMFTDLVGYTALAQRDESGSLRVLENHRKLVRRMVARYGGREVKTMGDAFLLEFKSALDAIRCAVEIQKAHRAYNEGESGKIIVRVGIHVGDVIHRAGDIYGDAVNVASRICPIAGGGEICISEQVCDQVRNKIPFALKKLQSRDLKNVVSPIDLFLVELPWTKHRDYKSVAPQPTVSVIRKVTSSGENEKVLRIGKLILRLTMKNRIVDAEVLNDPEIPAALARFSEEVDYARGETLSIVSGIQTVRVVIDSKNLPGLTSILPKKNLIGAIPNLTEIIVTLSEAALRTPGVIATMSTALFRNGINIFEYIHSTPNVIIVVESKDAQRTYRTLEKLAA